jgi:hypothetical protein
MGLTILFCAIVLFVLSYWYLRHRQRPCPRAIRQLSQGSVVVLASVRFRRGMPQLWFLLLRGWWTSAWGCRPELRLRRLLIDIVGIKTIR